MIATCFSKYFSLFLGLKKLKKKSEQIMIAILQVLYLTYEQTIVNVFSM
jgi:hypothetical protein